MEKIKKPLPFDSEVSNPVHGLVAATNAASFGNTWLSEPLTTYAQGWRDPSDIAGALEFLFPGVQVPRRFEFRKHAESSDFLTDSDDERSPGADFKRVSYTGSVQQAKTLNRGLTVFVDVDEVGGMPNWDQIYTGRLLRRCMRNDFLSACSLLINGAANTAKTWAADSDPDADLIDLVDGAGNLIGFNPNRLAFFGAAWTKRIKALRAKDTAGGFTSAGLATADQVAQYAGASRGRVIDIRYQNGAAKAKAGGGSYVVAFHAEDGAGPDDPSHAKRFWSPCEDGSQHRVYRRQYSEKLWAITVERYIKLVVTSTVGLAKYTVS
jgi:hypothetical protein